MIFERGSINNKVIKEIAEGNKTIVSIVDNNGNTVYKKDDILTSIQLRSNKRSAEMGEAIIFTATALNQYNNPISGIEISFNTETESFAQENTNKNGEAIVTYSHFQVGNYTIQAQNYNGSIQSNTVSITVTSSKIDTQIIVNGTSLFLTTLEGVGIDDQLVETVSSTTGATGASFTSNGGKISDVSKVTSATYYGNNTYNGCTWSAE